MPRLTEEAYINKLKEEARHKPKTEYVYRVDNPPGLHIGYVKATSDKEALTKAKKKYDTKGKVVVSIVEEDEEKGRTQFNYRGFTEKFVGSNFRI